MDYNTQPLFGDYFASYLKMTRGLPQTGTWAKLTTAQLRELEDVLTSLVEAIEDKLIEGTNQ